MSVALVSVGKLLICRFYLLDSLVLMIYLCYLLNAVVYFVYCILRLFVSLLLFVVVACGFLVVVVNCWLCLLVAEDGGFGGGY